jgi:1-acyl-sn-glycerol-3-phosphate acyltransferase
MPQFFLVPLKLLSDFFITLVLWFYFLGAGFLSLSAFSIAYAFSKNSESSFQLISSYFYRGFFKLADIIVPGLKISVAEEVRKISSSVIICNHISYLDPILLISLIKKQKTIIKGTFFKVPVFGWVVKNSGYIASPSIDSDIFNMKNAELIAGLKEYIKSGGNIFIFPEGTRSKDGTLGRFKKGAFSIAKITGAAITVLQIQNTGRLFIPGKFLFNTMVKNEITVKVLKTYTPDYSSGKFSSAKLSDEVREIFLEKIQ